MNRLRSLLRDYYPEALVAFPNLAHRAVASALRVMRRGHMRFSPPSR